MGNLYQDLVVDKSADLVIHAGDHGCERAGCCLRPASHRTSRPALPL
jgi:hypothetical protein